MPAIADGPTDQRQSKLAVKIHSTPHVHPSVIADTKHISELMNRQIPPIQFAGERRAFAFDGNYPSGRVTSISLGTAEILCRY
jgi:hypothetical protein